MLHILAIGRELFHLVISVVGLRLETIRPLSFISRYCLLILFY